MTPRISVVIPTYNGAEFIERTLASVWRQTRPPDEILVVDDCSRDNTRDIVQGLVAGAPVPLRMITLARNSGGPARPLNVGIESASGDLIVALEQDDTMRPSRIEGQEGAARAYPGCTLVAGRFSVKGNADGDMRPMWPVPQFSGVIDDIETAGRFVIVDARRAFRELMWRQFTGGISCYAFTKKAWRGFGGFNERVRVCVDLDFAFKAVLRGRMVIVNEVITDYAWRRDSLWRRDIERSGLEVALVRLRFASRRKDWAGDDFQRLETSVLGLARAALLRRDWSVLAGMLPTILAHAKIGRAICRKISRRIWSGR